MAATNPVLQTTQQILDEVISGLYRQQEWLNLRDMTLSSAFMGSLTRLNQELTNLDAAIKSETIEQDQLHSLANTATLVTSSLEVDEVLRRCMEEVKRLTNAERGFIILKDGDKLDFRVASGAQTFEGSHTILTDVLNTGQPLLTEEAYNDPRFELSVTVAQKALRSVLCVPLLAKEQVIGAVYVDNRMRSGIFGEREQRLMVAFANQAAVAIQNARFFADIRANLARITALKSVTDNVFASIGSGVLTLDSQGTVTLINRTAAELFRQTPEAVVGKPFTDLLPNLHADFLKEMLDVRTTQAHITLEEEAVLFGSRRSLRLALSPLIDSRQLLQGVVLVIDDLTEQYEREKRYDIARKYLPLGMVDNIQRIASLALGGERRFLTCLFLDVRPLNTFPSGLAPKQVMELLNRYLAVATDAINGAGGIVDKYMGTEVMALFNTQLNQQADDHAIRAIRAALNVREAFSQLNADGGKLHFRIGIHAGDATTGNVGTLRRRDFTALGDTINLAHRLLENAQAGQIILSAAVLDQAKAAPESVLRFEERGLLTVKGRQQPVAIWEAFRQ